jgi:hypothetical protein
MGRQGETAGPLQQRSQIQTVGEGDLMLRRRTPRRSQELVSPRLTTPWASMQGAARAVSFINNPQDLGKELAMIETEAVCDLPVTGKSIRHPYQRALRGQPHP